jgi:hypothetical protein
MLLTPLVLPKLVSIAVVVVVLPRCDLIWIPLVLCCQAQLPSPGGQASTGALELYTGAQGCTQGSAALAGRHLQSCSLGMLA